MGKLLTAMRHLDPITDNGWRVALYPTGTSLAAALEQEIIIQGELGNEVLPGTATLLSSYMVRGTADYLPDTDVYGVEVPYVDKGWRDMVASPPHMVAIRYQMTKPQGYSDVYGDGYSA